MEKCIMTKEETLKILMTVQVAYPNFKVENKEFTLEIWNDMFKEYSYPQVAEALKAHIATDTSGFAPTIGQLIEKVRMIAKPHELTEMEAWALVGKALRNGYYGAEQEFAKLPPLVKKAVGQPSQLRHWATSDLESIENVVQSNFMRSYRVVVASEKQFAKMPSGIKAHMESNRERQLLEEQPQKKIGVSEFFEEEYSREGIPMPENLKKLLEGYFD